MAPGSDSDYQWLQKIIYPTGHDSDAIVRDKPGVANTPHKKDFTSGEGMKIPAPYGSGMGASADVAVATANQTSAKGTYFMVDQRKYYAPFSLEGKLVENAKQGNAASQFTDQMKYEADQVEDCIGWELERQLFGSQAGFRGQIAGISIGATTTFQMLQPSDIIHMRVGMTIVLGTTASGVIRTGGTTNKAVISAVDVGANLVTFTGQNFTTLFGTAANGDYIFREGDAQNNATNGVCSAGLGDWNPIATPSATAFFGVVRTVSPHELAGCRYDASTNGDQLPTVFINARAQYMTQTGKGMPKGAWYIHPLYGAALRNYFEAKRIVDIERETEYKFGVQAFKIDNQEFVEAAACPYGVARFVADGAFVRASCGDQPSWAGDKFWLDHKTDRVQGLMRHYGNYAALHVNELMAVTLMAL